MNNQLSAYSLYRKDMENYDVLSDSDTYDLFVRYRKGDMDARDILTYSNQKLVTSIALKYAYLLPLEDLISYGNIGLLNAIDKYDYKMNNKFSTYATYWIIHEIRRAIEDKSSLVRLPSYMQDLVRVYNNVSDSLASTLQRTPTRDEIIDALPEDFPLDKLDDVIHSSIIKVTSLNATVGDDDDTEIGDLIADDSASVDEDSFGFNKEQYNAMKECIAYLSDKERFVLNARVFAEDKVGLKEIGESMHVSKERARQIFEESKSHLASLVKSRHPELFAY